MSRNRQKHMQEKKRRHERQIAEGKREEKRYGLHLRKRNRRMMVRRRVFLSEIDPAIVREVLRLVQDIVI